MRHILCISGGKDSTALAVWMRKNNPELPLEFVTADTGRELPELYAFLGELERLLGPIKRLVDGWHCPECGTSGVEPDFAHCPSCGGVVRGRDMNYYMERWANEESGPYLPSPGSRWCTKHLKIRPFDRYIGDDEATVYIAFRADEDRLGNYGNRPNVTYRYPFQEAGIDLAAVKCILANAGIRLPSFYSWRGVGGCWNCPFQRPAHWLGLSRHHPDLLSRAIEEESRSKFSYGRRPLPVLIRIAAGAERQLSLFDEEEQDTLGGACSICAK